jgi:hypothetical protein
MRLMKHHALHRRLNALMARCRASNWLPMATTPEPVAESKTMRGDHRHYQHFGVARRLRSMPKSEACFAGAKKNQSRYRTDARRGATELYRGRIRSQPG